jgi:hypothetical protein
MQPSDVLMPADIAVERLQALYESGGLQTSIDADGDLVVTRGVTCYAIPTGRCEQILLITYVGIKDEVDRQQKLEFANRVNNECSTVRAHVNRKQAVVFDFHIPVDGGVTGQAIVAATQFFLLATAHAIDQCDAADIVR